MTENTTVGVNMNHKDSLPSVASTCIQSPLAYELT
ncbi:hypothetical protein RSAG8_06361, partial [Rhizoctonia solani AG-8 WAC10335]